MSQNHPTIIVRHPTGYNISIDAKISGLIKKLWALDINTHCCCEGGQPSVFELGYERWGDQAPHNYAQIGFPGRHHLKRFFSVLDVKNPKILVSERKWFFESSISEKGKTDEDYVDDEDYYFAFFPPSDIIWINNKLSTK